MEVFEHWALGLPILSLFPSSAPCRSITQSPKAPIQAHGDKSNGAFHIRIKNPHPLRSTTRSSIWEHIHKK